MFERNPARGAEPEAATSDGAAPGRASTRALQRKSSSGGAPLPDAPRARMEASLGTDLGAVRVHDDAASHASAADLHANAYTTGSDIHFAAGQYAPADPFGLHLLAHEVAHTVQQDGGHRGVQAQLAVGASSDGAEREADRFADHVVHGAELPALSPAPASIQRQEATTPAPTEGDTSTATATATPTATATADPNAAFYAEVSRVVAAMLAEYQHLGITVPVDPPAAPAAASAEATAAPTAEATATPEATAEATAEATETPTATPTVAPQVTTTAYVDVPYWNNKYPKYQTPEDTGITPPSAYWNANDGVDDPASAEDDAGFRAAEIREYNDAVPDTHPTQDDHYHTVQNDNAMVAKGTPGEIKLLLETAITNHVITPPDIPGSDPQEWSAAWTDTLQAWMAKAGVGVDCSGLVYATLARIRDTVPNARTTKAVGSNSILDYATASGADVPDFGRTGTAVTDWLTIQPGDTMTIPGHVRIVLEVLERTDTLIRFSTSESTPNPSAAAGADTYEGPRWHEWSYQTDGTRQQRYTPDGPWSPWDEPIDSIIMRRHIAAPS